jgi:hypothetical protein
VVEYAPISPAIEFIPEWWKNLPKESRLKTFYPVPTMKTCTGIIDYYAKSIALPLWSEIEILIAESGDFSLQYADRTSRAETHSATQYAGFLEGTNYKHLKLASPWLFKCKEDINWMYSLPTYNLKSFDDFVMLPGLLNFSKQPETNIQLLVNTAKPKIIAMPFQTPFLLTPMSDKKVRITRHLVSKEEFTSMDEVGLPSTFIGKYKTHAKVKKCPYENHLQQKDTK